MKLPKNQVLWATYYDEKGNKIYLITSNEQRTTYNLYAIRDGKTEKILSAKSPEGFEEEVERRIFG